MLSIVTPSTVPAVSVDQAKSQCVVEHTDDDTTFSTVYIPAAIGRCENATLRQLTQATFDLVIDAFPCDPWIELPKPPLVSVTYVKYLDTSGVEQTWDPSNYVVSAPAGPRCRRGRIALAYGVTWPSTLCQANAVSIRFVCGYGALATDVPALLVAAMLMDIATLYENRQNVVIGTVAVEVPRTAREIYASYRSYSSATR
jgi:uncharacterized phiE125 gp8 family phage protein